MHKSCSRSEKQILICLKVAIQKSTVILKLVLCLPVLFFVKWGIVLRKCITHPSVVLVLNELYLWHRTQIIPPILPYMLIKHNILKLAVFDREEVADNGSAVLRLQNVSFWSFMCILKSCHFRLRYQMLLNQEESLGKKTWRKYSENSYFKIRRDYYDHPGRPPE